MKRVRSRDLSSSTVISRSASVRKRRRTGLTNCSASIAENSADLIAVVDKTGHRIYNNPAYERLLGYTQEELKRTISFQQIHPRRPAPGDPGCSASSPDWRWPDRRIPNATKGRNLRYPGISWQFHPGLSRRDRGQRHLRSRYHGRRMAMQNEKLSAIGQLAVGIAKLSGR
jgi:PAS domain-containing protein